MNAPLLEIVDLRYCYPDGTAALDGIGLEAREGESIALVGANGAGKSTLLSHLTGCLLAASGEVRVAGIAVSHRTLAEVRRLVGFVAQEPDDMLFMPTVEEDVAFGPLHQGLAHVAAAARALETLERVGAAHLLHRPSHRLSLGEKRRVSLAAVLAMSPRLLALDEPTAGLDPRGRRQLIELLQGIGELKLIATHDLDLARAICGRTIILANGKIAADAPTASVFADSQLMANCGL